jgi:hypothetical protein
MSKVLISVAVVSKWSLLLVIFGFQIKHNNYIQDYIKMVFTNELKEVFTNSMIIGVSWVWIGMKK